MKIAIMCSSFGIGGAENMVAQLVNGLKKSNFNIFVVTSNPKQNNHIQNSIDKSGVKYYTANSTKSKCLFARLKTYFKINRILKKEKPDIIHSNLSIIVYVIPYVLFHKVRLLHTVHNLPKKDLGFVTRQVLKLLVKMRKVSFSSISKEIQNRIIQEYNVERDKAPVIVNPVNCKKFSYCDKIRLTHKNQPVCFINVARLSPQKNQMLLIKAFRLVVDVNPQVILRIVGDGTERKLLEASIQQHNLEKNVFLLGAKSNIPEQLSESDIFVLSSDFEGLPLTILEAMAAGLPIISTNVGGISDIVKNNDNGILVHCNDEKALASAMNTLIQYPHMRISYGRKSEFLAQQYDVKNFIHKYTCLYNKIL